MRNQENITDLDQHIIDFVRELRLSKELTQLDLADAIHVSRGFIKDVESPNRSAKYNLRHINALADYFNISLKDFMPVKPFPVDNPSRAKSKPKRPAKTGRTPVKKATAKKSASKSVKKKA